MLNTQQLKAIPALRHQLLNLKLPHTTLPRAIADKAKNLISKFINTPLWQKLSFAFPTYKNKQYAVILNQPNTDQFMLLLAIWCPGISSPIRNHNTWAMMGVLQGQEDNQLWSYDASTPPYLTPIENNIMKKGNLQIMSERGIHSVKNCTKKQDFAASIHLYGSDLRNTRRQIFHKDSNITQPNPDTEFITLEEFLALE